MSKTSLILSILMTVALVIFMAPSIFAMNRGKVLRNIALWLAIFAGLGLIYQNFGPDSAHPLFSLPAGVALRMPQGAGGVPGDDKAHDDKAGNQGFTPPQE
jgi:hypothetical protein